MKEVKIKNWLKRNKIYFEVIVALSLSFMAIFLSIQSNKIAEAQRRIMEEENLPQIEIRKTQEYNANNKLYDNDIWLFFNRGGKVSDFNLTNYSIYKFTARPKYETFIYPLHGYLSYQGTLTGESEGLIFQIDNNHNGSKEVVLRDSLSNNGFYEIDTYAKVTYRDIFNKYHEEFYQISPVIGLIKKELWGEIENRFINGSKVTYFNQLFAKNIIDSISNNIKYQK